MTSAPLCLHTKTLLDVAWAQLLEAVIIEGRKSTYVVALGFVSAALQRAQVIGGVEVILKIAILIHGIPTLRQILHRRRVNNKSQRLAVASGILLQKRQKVRKIGIVKPQRLHIGTARTAVNAEAQQQKTVDDGNLASVNIVPAEDIGKCKVAVANRRVLRIAFYGAAVGKRNRSERYHIVWCRTSTVPRGKQVNVRLIFYQIRETVGFFRRANL